MKMFRLSAVHAAPCLLIALLLFFFRPALPRCDDTKAGAFSWRTAAGGRITGAPAVRDGRVHVLSRDNKLYVLDPGTGGVIRTMRLPARPLGGPCYGPDGTLYYRTEAGGIVGVNGSGGIVWQPPIQAVLPEDPVTDRRGILYIPTQNGILHSYTHTGRFRWKREVAPEFTSNPVYSASDDRIYITGHTLVYRIEPGGGITELQGSFVLGDTVGLIDLSDDSLVVVRQKELIVIGKSEEDYYRVAFPFGFIPEGFWSVAPGVFGVWSGDGTIHLYRDERGEVSLFHSGSADVDGIPSGMNSIGSVLLAGSDDWTVYGFDFLPLPDPGYTGRGTSGSDNPNGGGTNDPETIILRHLSRSSERSDIELFFDRLNKLALENDIGGSDLALLSYCETIARGDRMGSFFADRTGREPDLRARAVVWMGMLGNLETRRKLINILDSEFYTDVRIAAVQALTRLQSDSDGEVFRTIDTFISEYMGPEDSSAMAEAVIDFALAVRRYHGRYMNDELHRFLLELFRSDFPRDLRKKALDILHS